MLTAEMSMKDNGSAGIEAALKQLADSVALVGIPEDEARRQDGEITNASLLYIHTNGSPLAGLPARPLIEPALENSKEQLGDVLQEAAASAFEGNAQMAMQGLEKAGLAGQRAVQLWFDNPDNMWDKNRGAVEEAKIAKGSNPPKPLIDTGELRRAITYAVRKRGQ